MVTSPAPGGYLLRDGSFACFVVDVGSFEIRLGYSFETLPRVITRSTVLIQDSEVDPIALPCIRLGVHPFTHPPPTADWRVENVLSSATTLVATVAYLIESHFPTELCIPVVLVLPSYFRDAYREEIVNVVFHSSTRVFDGGLHLARAPVCAAFACGVPTAVVMDFGHEQTTIQAVVEGYALHSSRVNLPLGGRHVTKHLHAVHCSSSSSSSATSDDAELPGLLPTQLIPGWLQQSLDRHSSVSPSLRGSLETYWVEAALHHAKQTLLEVSPRALMAPLPTNVLTSLEKSLVLPDGTAIQCTPLQRFLVLEPYFHPDYSSFYDSLVQSDPSGQMRRIKHMPADVVDVQTLPRGVENCLSLCDVDTRTHLTELVFCGGGSNVRGAFDRLQYEVGGLMDVVLRPQTGSCGIWSGAALLSCVQSFQELFITRTLWQEEGAERMLYRMCP